MFRGYPEVSLGRESIIVRLVAGSTVKGLYSLMGAAIQDGASRDRVVAEGVS